MTSRELLYRKIKEELKKESGIKARVIAKRLSEKKGDVNSILYCMQYRSAFQRDDSYRWYLTDNGIAEEKVIPVSIVLPKAVEDKKKTNPSPVTCKKCMLYKNDTCFGGKSICSFFKNSPEISAAEMELWPKEMSGPYGTLHS